MYIIHVLDGWLDGGKDGMGDDGRNAIDAMDDHGCRHAGMQACNMYVYGCTWLHMVAHGCTWLHMVAHGCTWLHMAAHGCTWLWRAYPVFISQMFTAVSPFEEVLTVHSPSKQSLGRGRLQKSWCQMPNSECCSGFKRLDNGQSSCKERTETRSSPRAHYQTLSCGETPPWTGQLCQHP